MKFTKATLENGMKIITVPMPDNPSVTIMVMVETGSKYETKELNGLSHFLEHMMFKGTPKRPTASSISRELDAMGAHYNAFTTQEFTGYYAKVAAHRLDAALDVISDIYLNPLFEEAEVTKEKGVIVEEIRMYEDLPQRKVHEVLEQLLYGDQPAGWSVLGTEATVKSFTRQNFDDYRKAHYVSSATTVIVAGDIDEAAVRLKVEKAFAGMLTTPKQGKVPVREEQSAPAAAAFFKETDQTHVALAVRTFPVLDPRMPAMNVLSTVLGGSMSSRLFERLREQLGICYYVHASHDANTDHGSLVISAGVDNSRVHEAVREILRQCEKLRNEPVSAEELARVKDYLSGTSMLELETSDARAQFAGFQEVVKHKTELPDELIAKIRAVTSADVQNLAREIFTDQGLNLAVVGRFKDTAEFLSYLTFTA